MRAATWRGRTVANRITTCIGASVLVAKEGGDRLVKHFLTTKYWDHYAGCIWEHFYTILVQGVEEVLCVESNPGLYNFW